MKVNKQEGKILIVDDDQDVLSTARMFLKQHGFNVHTEANPQQIPSLLMKES